MARAFEVSDIIRRVRQRCDQENSSFISDAEMLDMIDSAYSEFYDLLTTAYERYNVTFATLNTVPGTQIYNLPANFYKLLGVDLTLSDGNKIELDRFEWADRNKHGAATFYAALNTGTNLEYCLVGEDQLVLSPDPAADKELTVWYIPSAPKITSTSQIINGVNGWEEIIILECCIRVQAKQEADTSDFVRQKENTMKRILETAQNRDPGSPVKVSDSRKLEHGFGPLGIFGRR